MFKSIQWKLVAVFILIIVAIMLVLGTFLQTKIADFYYGNFSLQINRTFTTELAAQIEARTQDGNPVKEIDQLLRDYSGRLGINVNRNYYLLSRRNAQVLATSQTSGVQTITYTDNIIKSMTGEIGDTVNRNLNYIDYAIPIGGSEGYIIYIRDTKDEILRMSQTTFIMVLQALLIGVLISAVFGFFLSRTITSPIVNLTQRAERLAQGDYDSRIEVRSKDEIGKLARTFNYMAMVITKTVGENAREKEKIETILKYMADGIIAFGATGEVIHINPAAKEMLDIKEEGTILFDEFFAKLGLDVCIAEFIYLDRNNSVEKDFEIGEKHFRINFAQFKSEFDKEGGVVVVIQDMTEVQKIDNMRREFVANVSHELRTPLTTIKSYAETLLEDVPDERENDKLFLSVISKEVDRMTRIVKELLTLSTLDFSELKQSKQYFSLDDLLKEVVGRLSLEAQQKNQTLSYESSTAIPQILADRDRIEQVVVNIVTNALKYSAQETGVVRVAAGYLYNEIYIKVKDNGIGIPAKDVPRIFERFYRVDKARARDNGGTGLGLAIAQEIVRLHAGTISISSKLGKGTEVLIKLPVVSET